MELFKRKNGIGMANNKRGVLGAVVNLSIGIVITGMVIVMGALLFATVKANPIVAGDNLSNTTIRDMQGVLSTLPGWVSIAVVVGIMVALIGVVVGLTSYFVNRQ